MAFRKISNDGTEEIFELYIKDGTGQVIGKWKCMKRDFYKVVKIVNNQYGMNMSIRYKDRDRDLEWAGL